MTTKTKLSSSCPIVSVIIPSYNHEKYVEECIDSVMRQTYPNIELIVIDDGSSDNSDSVIRKSLEKHCHKFRYIRKLNEGVPKTLNLGLKLSSGKYVSIIASDDVMLPQKTEKEVDVFLKSDDNVGMVYSDSIAMNEDGSVLYPYSKVQRHS